MTMLHKLFIAVLALQIGNLYVTNGNETDTVSLGFEIPAKRTCNIADLNLAETEKVTDCFPNKARNGIVHENDICYTSLSVPVAGETEISNTRLEESQIGIIKCHHGTWMHHELGEPLSLHRRGFFSFFVGAIVCAVICRRRRSSGATTIITKYPPSFNDPCKPADVQDTYYVESGQTNIVVTWSEPVATDRDNNGKPLIITQSGGLVNGSKFEGSTIGKEYNIRYKATDNDGLISYCHFIFQVKMYSCETAPWPTNGQRSCDKGSILGSVCTYSCTSGYELLGSATITCQGSPSPSWSTTPTCGVKHCPEPPLPDNGLFSCSSFTYQSTCTLNCDSGYTFTGGTTYHIQCQADRTWSSISTTCADTSPPVFDSCPLVQTFYADRGLTYTTVEWTLPTATDNRDGPVVPQQIGGLPYGSEFPVGSSVVTYMAIDSEGNQSHKCAIIIRVEETICRHPLDSLQDSYLDFSCNSATYTYGVECDLSCKFNYHLIGTNPITCEQNSSNLAEGYWSWGFGDQPKCNVTACPDLDPPINGALTLDYVGIMKIYTMFCNFMFTIPEVIPGFTGQWVCQNSGLYTPNIDVPDCTLPVNPRNIKLLAELYYYDGECSDEATEEQILSNLQQIMDTTVNTIVQTLCAVYSCTIRDVNVICGEVSTREKRDVTHEQRASRAAPLSYLRDKRQSQPTVILEFAISTDIKLGNGTFLEAVNEVDRIQNNILKPAMVELVNNGTLDIAGMTTGSFEMQNYGDLQCDSGYYLDAIICVPCPAGYYLNVSSRCEPCSVGTYSDEAGLTSCKTCQTGYTTLQTGSKNESQCIELCPAGQYSPTGTVPCSLCANGYYQSETGQTSCIKCDSGTTELSGSVSSSACKAIDESAIDECASDPCNGHICANLINDYVCTYSNGWSGENCMTPPDFCVDVTCANGGTCSSTATEFICTCVTGHTGRLCEVAPVDGGWSDWSDWTSCTADCDGGTQNRSRICDSPVPSTYGADCVGDAFEIQACNQEACPTCPDLARSSGLLMNCTDTIMGRVCTLSCSDGYILPVNSSNSYTCGYNTNYEWTPNANPPDCKDPDVPSRIDISGSTEVTVTIANDDIQDVKQRVNENLSDNIPCVAQGTCSPNVEIENSTRNQSTGSIITVKLSVNLTETGSLNIQEYIQTSNASAPLQELIDAINNLETAAAYINTSSSSIFDVTVNGVTYTHDSSTLTISGNVSCPEGQIASEGVCVSCPEGTYYIDGYCSFCEKGTYSSISGQKSCTYCPTGLTTTTIGSYAQSQCVVYVTSTITSTSVTTTVTSTTTVPAVQGSSALATQESTIESPSPMYVNSTTSNSVTTTVTSTTPVSEVQSSSTPATKSTNMETTSQVYVNSTTSNSVTTTVTSTTPVSEVQSSSTPATKSTNVETTNQVHVNSTTSNSGTTTVTSTTPVTEVKSSSTPASKSTNVETTSQVNVKATTSISITTSTTSVREVQSSSTLAAVQSSSTLATQETNVENTTKMLTNSTTTSTYVTSTVTSTTPVSAVQSSSTFATIETNTENSTQGIQTKFIAIGIAVVALVMSIGVCGIVIYRKKCPSSSKTDSTTNNSRQPLYENTRAVIVNPSYSNGFSSV